MTAVLEAPPVAAPAARRVRRSWLRRSVAAGWLVFVVAHLALSGRWWLWSVVDIIPPLLFLVVPAVLLTAALPMGAWAARQRGVRSRRPAVGLWQVRLLAVAALLLSHGLVGINPAALWPGAAPAGPPDLRVVSWNVEFWTQTDDPEHFYSYLRGFDADVYLLQEYLHTEDGPVEIDDLSRVRSEFPGYQVIVAGELLTLSRLPVVGGGGLDAGDRLAAAGLAVPADIAFRPYHVVKSLRTDVRVGDRVLSFYNTHQPVHLDTRISPLTGAFYDVPREQFGRRQVHLELLRDDLAGNPNPVLVAGDFNATATSGEVAVLKSRLRDATPAMDSVYPSSWAFRGLPLWRLDWVFTSPELVVTRYLLRDQEGMSDHRAQEVTLRLG